MNLHKIMTLVRREFQEHRMLWIGPLGAAGLMLVLVALSNHVQNQGIAFDASAPLAARGYLWAAGFSLFGLVAMIGLIAGVLAGFYALDCLYAERKDRSILFWKSLPVSDTETVLSKFLVAVLLVPLGVLLLTVLMQPLMALVLYARFEPLRPYFGMELLTTWIRLVPYLMATGLFAILWFAPVTAWLMLASVGARRAPLAIAVLPALAAPIENWVFDTRYVGRFLAERLFPWPRHLPSLIGPYIAPGEHGLNWWQPFQDPGLWIGLAVAAGMLYMVIRLRRYRDDT